MSDIDREMLDFLVVLDKQMRLRGYATAASLRSPGAGRWATISRAEGAARRRCIRRGFAKCERQIWFITDAGRAALSIPEAGEEADAARYRWLRSRDLDTIDAGGIFIGRVPENTVINGEDADRAIDAAISPRIKDNANG